MRQDLDIKQSDNISKGFNLSNDQLNHILENHPYFQLGLMEKSKRLHMDRHIDSLKTARKCAILFPERALLYAFIHENDESSKEKSLVIDNIPKIEEHVESEELEAENIVEKPEAIIQNEALGWNKEEEGFSKSLEKEYLIEAVNQSIQIEASEEIL